MVEIERKSFATRHYRQHRFTARDFRALAERRQTLFLVAQRGAQIVGDLIGSLPTDRRRLARIDSVAVDPQCRSHGVGRLLLRRLLNRARRAGHAGVALEVAVVNLRAQALFATLGFAKERTLRRYYGKNLDGIRMVLRFG